VYRMTRGERERHSSKSSRKKKLRPGTVVKVSQSPESLKREERISVPRSSNGVGRIGGTEKVSREADHANREILPGCGGVTRIRRA